MPGLFNLPEEASQFNIQNNNTSDSFSITSPRRFWNGISRLLTIANNWTGVQTFTNASVRQLYTLKQTFTFSTTNPSQIVNLDNGSYIVIDLRNASGTFNLSLSNGKLGGTYWIQIIQSNTKVDVTLANEGRYDGETGSLIVGENGKNYSIYASFTGNGYILNIASLT